MNKKFSILMIGFIAMMLVTTTLALALDFDNPAGICQNGFSIINHDANGATVVFQINKLTNSQWRHGNETFDIVSYPVERMVNNPEGAPNLINAWFNLAIPWGAKVSYRIVDSTVTTFQGINVIPTPNNQTDSDHSATTWNKDMAIYGKNAFWHDPLSVSEPLMLDGQVGITGVVTPTPVNPVTGEMRVYWRLVVQFSFDGGNGHIGDRGRSWLTDDGKRLLFLNFADLDWMNYDFTDFRRDTLFGWDYQLNSLCNMTFLPALNKLKSHRISFGIKTELSDVSYGSVWQYQDALNMPGYYRMPIGKLIPGDLNDYVPAEEYHYAGYYYTWSDNMYVNPETGFPDPTRMPDMAIGRTRANSLEFNSYVDHVIASDLNNPPKPDAFYDPVLVGEWSNGTNAKPYIHELQISDGIMTRGGLNPIQQYAAYDPPVQQLWPIVNWDSWGDPQTQALIGYYANVQGYIPYTAESMNGIVGYGTPTTLVSHLNNGHQIVVFRGHGDCTYWQGDPWSAFMSNTIWDNQCAHPPGWYPFIFSITCATGEPLWWQGCLAEHMVLQNITQSTTRGSLGVMTNSNVSWTKWNKQKLQGVQEHICPKFNSLFQDTLLGPSSLWPGMMEKYANIYQSIGGFSWFTPNNTYARDNNMYSCLVGDPLTTVRVFPPELVPMTHSPCISVGLDSCTVQVHAAETATIAISHNDSLWGLVTSSVGMDCTYTFIIPAWADSVKINAWSNNYGIPNIQVVTRYIPTPKVSANEQSAPIENENPAVKFGVSASPNPFNGAVNLKLALTENGPAWMGLYDIAGREVAILFDGQGNAGINDIAYEAGSLPSGIYFCRTVAGENTAITKLVLTK